MRELDNLLENGINALESGAEPEQIIRDLPDGAGDVAQLIQMAADIRSTQHPEINDKLARAQQQKVMAAAVSLEKVKSRPHPSLPAWLNWRQHKFLTASSFAIIGFFLVTIIGVGVYLAGPSGSHYATLMDSSGLVQVASAQTPQNWATISNGDQIEEGQHIRTGDGSAVTLLFFDGSRTTVGPDSDLVLSRLNGSWGNVLQVQFTQNAGDTSHSVVPLRGSTSFFKVFTPSGQVSVHGTAFSVQVEDASKSIFSVVHGKVEVSSANSSIFLTNGQATLVLPGQTPASPAYQFGLRGTISAIQGSQWMVAGVTFTVEDATVLKGPFQIGDPVNIQGRILASGERIADLITPANTPNTKATFTGVIETMGVDSWQISGQAVLVNNETEITKGLQVGDPVQVNFSVLPDGSWLAKAIETTENENNDQSTPTATDTVAPELTQSPTGSATAPTEATGTTTPTAVGTSEMTSTPLPGNRAGCQGGSQQPEAVRLAQQYGVTYQEIIGWFCQGFGFGEIKQAYDLSLQSGLPVSQIFAMRTSGLGWGQIKQQLSPKSTQASSSGDNGNGNSNNNGNGNQGGKTKPTKSKGKPN
jgi:hypothetical protein